MSACGGRYFVAWTAEGIKIFGWLAQVASTVFFTLGLSSPDL
jgi:hypothetical protein